MGLMWAVDTCTKPHCETKKAVTSFKSEAKAGAYCNQRVHHVFTRLQAGGTCHFQEQLLGRLFDL